MLAVGTLAMAPLAAARALFPDAKVNYELAMRLLATPTFPSPYMVDPYPCQYGLAYPRLTRKAVPPAPMFPVDIGLFPNSLIYDFELSCTLWTFGYDV